MAEYEQSVQLLEI